MKSILFIIFIIFIFLLISCVEVELQGDLTFECGLGGTTNPSGTITVMLGSETAITAIPENGYFFDEWTIEEGDAVIEDTHLAAATVVLDSGNAVIYAHFSSEPVEDPPLLFEYNVFNYEQPADPDNPGDWGYLPFTHEYPEPPVVVMSIISRNETVPVVVRVEEVTETGCFFKIDEWQDDYYPEVHAEEMISYMVFEEGEHSLFNNTVTVYAGKEVLGRENHETGHDFTTINYPQPFEEDEIPVIISQCMSTNELNAYYSVTTRYQNITHESFDIRLQERRQNVDAGIDILHQDEEVGWLAFSHQYSPVPGMRYEIFQAPAMINENWYNLSFHNLYINLPFFIGAIQTYEGNDPAALRCYNLSQTGIRMRVQEDPTTDDDHSSETIGYICIELD